MMHHWHNAIHQGKSVRILFLDYSKAFDLVDHTLLIAKFKHLEVPDILVRWLGAFLSNRQQRVRINKDVSNWLTLNGAMPQGSWLGPLCFIVYVSDMELPGNLMKHKYIDDTTLSESLSTPSDSNLQSATGSLVTWSMDNNMRVNGKKTKEMIMCFKKSPWSLPPISIN